MAASSKSKATSKAASKAASREPSSPAASPGIPWFSLALLIALLALSIDALHLQLRRANFLERARPLLDPADKTLRKNYTGIEPIDRFLLILVIVFIPVSSGEMPELTLFAFQFSGQILAGVMLWTLNGLRQENKWNSSSFATLWALAMQIAGYGVAMPLCLALDLLFSSSNPKDLKLRDATPLNFAIPAFTLAYSLTSFLQLAPFEGYLHQTLIVLWQPFPIYLAILLWAFSETSKRANPVSSSSSDKKATDRDAANHAYGFAVINAAVLHWIAILVMVVAAVRPDIFPDGVAERLTPQRVFIPHPVRWYGTRDFNDISMQFLQYDQYIGGAASIVWATTLANQVGAWNLSYSGLLTIIRDTILAGPAGAALLMLQRRDEATY